MRRKFGNHGAKYRDPNDLMAHPSCMGTGLCWSEPKVSRVVQSYGSFDGRFGINKCIRFYDICCRLKSL